MRDEELVDLGINARRQVRADGKNTAGHCVLTCDYIAERFELMKIPYHTVVGFFQTDKRRIKHVWIMLEDGRILDPTADQFNSWLEEPMPDVYWETASGTHPIRFTKKGCYWFSETTHEIRALSPSSRRY